MARRRAAPRSSADRRHLATAYTELLDGRGAAAPIADFLIKPFHRERFALAVDRGRQWRKQALEEMHWHAVLSIELRDRAAQMVHAVDARVPPARPKREAMTALLVERMPDVAAHGERVARYARRSPASSTSIARSATTSTSPRDFTTRQAGDARGADLEAVAAHAGETAIMRQHVEMGAEILESTRTLAFAAPAVARRTNGSAAADIR